MYSNRKQVSVGLGGVGQEGMITKGYRKTFGGVAIFIILIGFSLFIFQKAIWTDFHIFLKEHKNIELIKSMGFRVGLELKSKLCDSTLASEFISPSFSFLTLKMGITVVHILQGYFRDQIR